MNTSVMLFAVMIIVMLVILAQSFYTDAKITKYNQLLEEKGCHALMEYQYSKQIPPPLIFDISNGTDITYMNGTTEEIIYMEQCFPEYYNRSQTWGQPVNISEGIE